MFKFFDRIREKPKHVRDNYALLFAGIFSVIALALWLITLSQSEPKETDSVMVENSESSAEAPFTTLLTEIRSHWESVKNSYKAVESEEATDGTLLDDEATSSTTPQVDMKEAFTFATSSETKAIPKPVKGETVLIATTSSIGRATTSTSSLHNY